MGDCSNSPGTIVARVDAVGTPVPVHSLSLRALIRSAMSDLARSSNILTDSRHTYTYPEVRGHLDAILAGLQEHGIRTTDCITVELTNSLTSALAVLALLDGEYDLVLTSAKTRKPDITQADLQPPRFSRWVLRVTDDPSIPRRQARQPSSYLSLAPNPNYTNAAPPFEDRSPRLYAHTSGSLGTSKFALHTHSGIASCACRVIERLRLDASCRIALPIPIFHMYGLRVAFISCFIAGASIDFQSRANLLSYLEREEEFGPDVAFMTPTFCEALLRVRKRPRRYRFIVTGGDRLSDGGP